jgi:uncharacterized membrane-anchored protein
MTRFKRKILAISTSMVIWLACSIVSDAILHLQGSVMMLAGSITGLIVFANLTYWLDYYD